MRRTATTALAAVAAVSIVASLATSGSAQSPTATSLHLKGANQKSIGFGPNHQPRQGDRIGFGERVTGDDTGFDRGICTVIGTSQALCTVQVTLADGTLSAQGTIPLTRPNKSTPFTVTGGTGRYDGARGTALVTDTTSATTDIQISLLP